MNAYRISALYIHLPKQPFSRNTQPASSNDQVPHIYIWEYH